MIPKIYAEGNAFFVNHGDIKLQCRLATHTDDKKHLYMRVIPPRYVPCNILILSAKSFVTEVAPSGQVNAKSAIFEFDGGERHFNVSQIIKSAPYVSRPVTTGTLVKDHRPTKVGKTAQEKADEALKLRTIAGAWPDKVRDKFKKPTVREWRFYHRYLTTGKAYQAIGAVARGVEGYREFLQLFSRDQAIEVINNAFMEVVEQPWVDEKYKELSGDSP